MSFFPNQGSGFAMRMGETKPKMKPREKNDGRKRLKKQK